MGSTYEIQSMLQEFEQAMGMGLVETLISEIPSMLISLAVYVFTALSLYTIAARRGIKNPWLAWIPYANVWLLGCIADQYRAVARGQTKYRRRVLLFTEIAGVVIGVLVVVLLIVMLVNMSAFLLEHLGFGIGGFLNPDNMEILEGMEGQLSEADAQELLAAIMAPAVGMVLLALVMLPVSIVNLVFTYIALHDIYSSCEPGNATLYLVLSIFISYAQPIFLFLCRNKDMGMPMRQVPQPEYQPVYEQPGIPEEPWERKEP